MKVLAAILFLTGLMGLAAAAVLVQGRDLARKGGWLSGIAAALSAFVLAGGLSTGLQAGFNLGPELAVSTAAIPREEPKVPAPPPVAPAMEQAKPELAVEPQVQKAAEPKPQGPVIDPALAVKAGWTLEEFTLAGVWVYMSEAEVIGLLGEPEDTREGARGDGKTEKYLFYPGLTVHLLMLPPNDFYSVWDIRVTSPEYATLGGIVVGDALEKVLAVYGKPTFTGPRALQYNARERDEFGRRLILVFEFDQGWTRVTAVAVSKL